MYYKDKVIIGPYRRTALYLTRYNTSLIDNCFGPDNFVAGSGPSLTYSNYYYYFGIIIIKGGPIMRGPCIILSPVYLNIFLFQPGCLCLQNINFFLFENLDSFFLKILKFFLFQERHEFKRDGRRRVGNINHGDFNNRRRRREQGGL